MFMKENEFIKNVKIQEMDNSIILLAKQEIIVPEKKIVLLDEINNEEKQILKKLCLIITIGSINRAHLFYFH